MPLVNKTRRPSRAETIRRMTKCSLELHCSTWAAGCRLELFAIPFCFAFFACIFSSFGLCFPRVKAPPPLSLSVYTHTDQISGYNEVSLSRLLYCLFDYLLSLLPEGADTYSGSELFALLPHSLGRACYAAFSLKGRLL